MEKFISIKPIQNDQVKSLAYALLHNYREKISTEEHKNNIKNHP